MVLQTDIKIKTLFLTFLLPILSVGQTSFVGKYKAIPDIADSVLRPGVEGVYVVIFEDYFSTFINFLKVSVNW